MRSVQPWRSVLDQGRSSQPTLGLRDHSLIASPELTSALYCLETSFIPTIGTGAERSDGVNPPVTHAGVLRSPGSRPGPGPPADAVPCAPISGAAGDPSQRSRKSMRRKGDLGESQCAGAVEPKGMSLPMPDKPSPTTSEETRSRSSIWCSRSCSTQPHGPWSVLEIGQELGARVEGETRWRACTPPALCIPATTSYFRLARPRAAFGSQRRHRFTRISCCGHRLHTYR
jgi:hypothetical protein